MKKNFNDFNKFIKIQFKNKWNIPGISIVIFNSDNILHTFTYGYADLQSKRKLKITDKFCIASCSKSILCTAISSLIENKKIPNIWNMTLEKAWSKNIHESFKKVKVKQLAQHNSGIASTPDNPDDIKNFKKYSKIEKKLENLNGYDSRKKLTNIILKIAPIYEPGSKFVYSNWGYGILAAILEKHTKKNIMILLKKK